MAERLQVEALLIHRGSGVLLAGVDPGCAGSAARGASWAAWSPGSPQDREAPALLGLQLGLLSCRCFSAGARPARELGLVPLGLVPLGLGAAASLAKGGASAWGVKWRRKGCETGQPDGAVGAQGSALPGFMPVVFSGLP